VFGRKRVLPVNINSLNITETEFSADLNPVRATVTVSLTVIEGPSVPYQYTRAMTEAMSLLNLAKPDRRRQRRDPGVSAVADPRSRYRAVPEVLAPDPQGRVLPGKDFRRRPDTTGTYRHVVREGDRIDQLASTYYNLPLIWWNVCDANPDFLSPFDLLAADPVVTTLLAGALHRAGRAVGGPGHATAPAAGELRACWFQDDVVLDPVRRAGAGGGMVTVYLERPSRSLLVTHNQVSIPVEAAGRADAGAGLADRAGSPGDSDRPRDCRPARGERLRGPAMAQVPDHDRGRGAGDPAAIRRPGPAGGGAGRRAGRHVPDDPRPDAARRRHLDLPRRRRDPAVEEGRDQPPAPRTTAGS